MPTYCSVCPNKTDKGCSSCKAVLYCSRRCQKLIWSAHKYVCKGDVFLFKQPALSSNEMEYLNKYAKMNDKDFLRNFQLHQALSVEQWNSYVTGCDRVEAMRKELNAYLWMLINWKLKRGDERLHWTLSLNRMRTSDLASALGPPHSPILIKIFRSKLVLYCMAYLERELFLLLDQFREADVDFDRAPWSLPQRYSFNRFFRQALIYYQIDIKFQGGSLLSNEFTLAKSRLENEVANLSMDKKMRAAIFKLLHEKIFDWWKENADS